MKRVLLIYNPRSSRFSDVQREVFPKVRELKGYIVGKYEVKPIDIEQNISNLAKIIHDDDIVISAGGDATGVIAANAIIKSNKSATLAALPYGNFNDLARTLKTKRFEDIGLTSENGLSRGFRSAAARGLARSPHGDGRERRDPRKAISDAKLYPLEILIDGKHWRYATCYVTIGMTAEAVKLYDSNKMRRKLKNSFGRRITSYTALANWYFKHRHKHIFLPAFKLNGEEQHLKTSDYAAINGRSMARVMKGGEDYMKPKIFRHETDRLATSFPRLAKLMLKSIFHRIPGTDTTGDILEFINPATFTLQAEGESKRFENVNKVEIRKATKCIKVIQN